MAAELGHIRLFDSGKAVAEIAESRLACFGKTAQALAVDTAQMDYAGKNSLTEIAEERSAGGAASAAPALRTGCRNLRVISFALKILCRAVAGFATV